ncbi:hypothetical protein [Curtobacterium sp. MCBA15_004]|nr:hypothetical protein [Curtobacterium sp. MCBA15_004]WIA96424.1 hypothetical protein QOL16_15200 [Curtobacterium sp. MCBA15_004]
MDEPDLTAHRTRSNRRPDRAPDAPPALVAAVDEVYDALEDRS